MSRGVYVALSGAVAQEQALETTATNLANASTPGYQRMRPVFKEVLANASRGTNGGANGSKTPALHYAAITDTALDRSRGSIRSTGRPLDVALPENTYLAVTTPRGERFTRAGSITVGADGILRTCGASLSDENGKPIQISGASEAELAITADGSIVRAQRAGETGDVVGKLKLVRGADEGTTFTHEGGGLVAARGAVAPDSEGGALELGVLEDSNATPIAAMTELVTATRTFEAFQRMLDTFGECDRKVLTTVPGATE